MKSKVSFRKEGLLTGILITYLAHAISVAENPIMSYEQSWDGFNYNVIIGHTRGTITFAQDTIVGAFRNERSERINEYPQTKAIDYFRDAPQLICDIAIADTLEYLYDKVDKTIMPVATTAFWSEGEELFSCDRRRVL